MTTATVFLKKQEQKKIDSKVAKVLEKYDSFVLVEATDKQIQDLKGEGFKVIPQEKPTAIKLGAITINTDQPRFNEMSAVLPHSAYTHKKDPGPDRHHYIVQFIGPIKEEWKKEIERLGGTIGEPLPSHSYIVEMDGKTREAVINLPSVRWVGHYDPAYRLAPNLLQEVQTEEQKRAQPMAMIEEPKGELPIISKEAKLVPNAFLVSFQSPKNLQEAIPAIKATGAEVSEFHETDKILTISFPPETPDIADKLKQIASIHGVLTVEALKIKKPRNNIATRIMTGTLDSAGFDMPLTGKGEIIAIADTGIDTGDADTIHEDFRGRISGIKSWPITPAFDSYIKNPRADDGPADLDSGHGTHVTGSVLGSGTKSRGSEEGAIRGLAYNAGLFFQAIEQELDWKKLSDQGRYGKYLLAGIPDDLGELFKEAYEAGARIHTNSWGGGDPGAYDIQSRYVDLFTWENKDMTILFAAGNDGKDGDQDGKVDAGSITPPSTAKNCIAVGASENLRNSFQIAYGRGWPLDFPEDPITKDKVADNPDDIAAFSSRGPCQGMRFKPDVVAPGTFILSTKSSRSQGKGWAEFDDFYFYMGGTSMATPLTAGATALIREYLRKTTRRRPSAALVKAALIHTALRRPYRYAASDFGSAFWDPEQGWGHVNLKPFVEATPGWTIRFYDVKNGLQTGQSWVRRFKIARLDHPVKVTLVWTDYPAVADKYPGLVNNLDLIVTAPDGKDYHGNVFSPPYDSTLDNANNVEVVSIEKPQKGIYKVTVVATEVREGPQDFAVVYSGDL
jgi:serine protease AprX